MSTQNAKRVTRTHTQTIQGSSDRVFPLLCPVRERDWLDGWTADIVYSDSGVAEQGCVFRTGHDAEPDTIWTIAIREEDPKRLVFVMTTPGVRVGRLQIDVADLDGDRSSVAIEYTFTSLGAEGDAFVASFTEEIFQAKMDWWERAMNHYLATGECLRRPIA